MIESFDFFTRSPEETQEVGKKIASFLKAGDVLCLTGDLGAGKTTLIKGISLEWANIPPQEVTSPTFTYFHMYCGTRPLYHFDLYRLSSNLQFCDLGFHEFLSRGAVCCIEWPDRIPTHLSFEKVLIDISYQSPEERLITFRRPRDPS